MKNKHVPIIKLSDYHDKKLFLKAVSECCLRSLSARQRAVLCRHGEKTYFFNFTLGERIRNDFLYPQEQMIEYEMKKKRARGEDWIDLLIDSIAARDLAENAHEYSMDVILMIVCALVE